MPGSASAGDAAAYGTVYVLVSLLPTFEDTTPLRTKSLNILLPAPPDDMRWGEGRLAGTILPRAARPKRDPAQQPTNSLYTYSHQESLAIWELARPFLALRAGSVSLL